MGEPGTQDRRRNLNTVSVRQSGREIPRFTGKCGDRGAGPDIDQFVTLGPLDHAANRVPGPFARRNEFRVALQDRSASQPVFFFNQDAGLPEGGQ